MSKLPHSNKAGGLTAVIAGATVPIMMGLKFIGDHPGDQMGFFAGGAAIVGGCLLILAGLWRFRSVRDKSAKD